GCIFFSHKAVASAVHVNSSDCKFSVAIPKNLRSSIFPILDFLPRDIEEPANAQFILYQLPKSTKSFGHSSMTFDGIEFRQVSQSYLGSDDLVVCGLNVKFSTLDIEYS